MPTRRTVLTGVAAATAATAGTLVLPARLRADGHPGDVFRTQAGEVIVHPVSHASLVLELPVGTIHVDPVGGAAAYAELPPPDLILVTHEHGDHYDAETLAGLAGPDTGIIANPAVYDRLDRSGAAALANAETATWRGYGIAAVPAYNTTEGRLGFHPRGRDNGYVLDLGGYRIYISGDTEDIPEMRALQGIDMAFVSMNLPFTMDAVAAADAVRAFAPATVYPYHYRGQGPDGTQDPGEFAEMLADRPEIEVRFGEWYG